MTDTDPYIVVMFDRASLGTQFIVLNAFPCQTWWDAAHLAGELMDEAIQANLDIVLIPGDRSIDQANLLEILRADLVRYNFGRGA